MKVRIIPIVMLVVFLSVVVKLSDVVFNIDQIGPLFSEVVAFAQDEKSDEPKPELGGFSEDAEWSPGERKGPSRVQPSEVSEMEKTILENLAKRREKLQKWQDSISMKENILNATEKKINRKMDELKELQVKVETLLAQYKGKEDRKVKRLVKIYENMKPKDAARIFEEMELSILLEVVDNMKEAKAAPILAKMNSLKAKEITTRLARQRRLNVN